ncbi:MAG: hypothetical protein HYV63_30825 [Candidatus Schekmanbacteria bacterium]|nr:hypothetical protein [Candidatus Schekmanbacteria bacterium]
MRTYAFVVVTLVILLAGTSCGGSGAQDERSAVSSPATEGGSGHPGEVPPPSAATGAGQAAAPGSPAGVDPQTVAQGLEQGGQALAQAMQQMNQAIGQAAAVEPVDFRELKALMPETAAGLTRRSATGEKSAAFGMKISKVDAAYQAQGGGSAEVTVTDMGTASGFAAVGAMAWTMVDIDRETETGYERTTTIGGHKGFERFENGSQSGNVQVFVASRFLVEVKGRGLSMENLKQLLSAIGLDKLAALAGTAPAAAAAAKQPV